jgi:hypothetical protein
VFHQRRIIVIILKRATRFISITALQLTNPHDNVDSNITDTTATGINGAGGSTSATKFTITTSFEEAQTAFSDKFNTWERRAGE